MMLLWISCLLMGIVTCTPIGKASQTTNYDDSSYGLVAGPQDENLAPGPAGIYGPENPEPVFSDVSDLEPVYSFSSRSSYQRGRAVFAQSRYTPGEPFYPVMPIVVRTANTPSKGGNPANIPAMHGF